MRTLARVSLLLALAVAPLTRSHAQLSSFITTLGRDTLSIEQYRRAGDSITGDWVTLYGGVMFHHYDISLRPDGTVSRYRLTLHRANGKAEGSVDFQFGADSVTITATEPDTVRRVAAANAFPVFASTVAAVELITSDARAHGRDSSVTRVMRAFGPYQAGGFPVVFFSADSARFGNPAAPLYARVDRDGRIEGISARATTTRSETRRVAAFDLASVVRHFPDVAPEAPIVGFTSISPRDTVRSKVGGATITVDYGRPAARGRAVFTHGVLGDTLWRAGANAATQFTTDRDLTIGGSTLRAGTYSMWVRASPDDSRFELVFNSQTGQWGTEHHTDRDVLSVPLRRRQAQTSPERLTISLAPSSGPSELQLAWLTTNLVAPISVQAARPSGTTQSRPSTARTLGSSRRS